MVKKEIRILLLKRLKVSRQALSLRAKRIKEKYGPMSTEEAVYIIAHQNKIDLSRYLSISQIDRVRSLVPKEVLPSKIGNGKKAGKKSIQKKRQSNGYPLVRQNEIDLAFKIGSQIYPLVFILENSMRNLIRKELKFKYGKQWWVKANIKTVRDNVNNTKKKEERFPYRERRGKDLIMYANYNDLKQIILNERESFKSIFVDMQWFEQKMNETYMARNSLAHSGFISDDDRKRIELFFRDWSRLLENAGIR